MTLEDVVDRATSRPSEITVTTRQNRSARAARMSRSIRLYYHAPEEEFAALEPILAGIADSFQIKNDWVQRERVAAMRAAAIIGNMIQQQSRQMQQRMDISRTPAIGQRHDHARLGRTQ